jgi:heterotetrameric sarcosine oxidase delta subunit
MRIPCPICGERDSGEFTYSGDATIEYPALDADQAAWYGAVFERTNPRGVHTEFWHHTTGCRRFIVVKRNTLTHEVHGAMLAHGPDPDRASPDKTPQARGGAKSSRKVSDKSSATSKGGRTT